MKPSPRDVAITDAELDEFIARGQQVRCWPSKAFENMSRALLELRALRDGSATGILAYSEKQVTDGQLKYLIRGEKRFLRDPEVLRWADACECGLRASAVEELLVRRKQDARLKRG